MSSTFVPVTPVKMRSFNREKKEYESFSDRNFPAVEEFLKAQGRFAHLFKPTYRKDVIDEIQQNVDANWNRIVKLCAQN